MQFLYPTFLWALLALAIPIIIHLFYFRRFKKVYFTNVRFLKELKEETSSRNKLKNLLVLLMRMLAFSFLVLAFAQPFLSKNAGDQVGRKAISIFIDNSFSMNALSQDVPLIDLAKDRARAIIQAYNEDDEFQVLTQDFEGRHQRLVAKEDALSFIDEIEPSPSAKELSKVFERQKQALEGSQNNKIIFCISDFQKNICDIDEFQDTTVQLNLLPLQAVREQNISLDSAWLVAPVPMINQTNALIVKISNYSDEPAEEVRLSLKYEGETKPMGTLDIPSSGSAFDTINLSIRNTGWHEAELSITDYPVQFDDHYKISFEVSEQVRVLSLNSKIQNKFLTAAFKGLAQFELVNQSVNQIQYASLNTYDLVILNDLETISSGLSSEIKNYVSNGGNVLVFPSDKTNLENFNTFLSSLGANSLKEKRTEQKEVFQINTDAFVFKDVFEKTFKRLRLPVTETHYESFRIQAKGEQALLSYRDGKSYLSQYNLEDGFVYLCAAPLADEYNDIVRNAEIFIPMLYKMAISKAKRTTLAYTIGRNNIIEVDNEIRSGEMVYSISGEENFIPGQLNIGSKIVLDIHNQIRKDGFYELRLEDQMQAKLAFNYDRKESLLDYLGEDELLDKFGENAEIYKQGSTSQFASVINEKGKASSLWKWCLIAVLLFLALESMILRFWKT